MPEQKDKFLDDQLKEAQIAREQAEIAKLKSEDEKLKEETALVRKQVNAKWYSGRSLAQITAVALTVVALYSAVDQLFLKDIKQHESRLVQLKAEVAQAALDSLNIERKGIAATIDSLKIRASISAAFGELDSIGYASALKQYNMITANNYYDRRLNPDGAGIENDFEVRVVKGDTVTYDATTSLTWQATTELPQLDWERAQAYVDTLTYAGFDDWRLPTLEEAMSLMEPEENEETGRFVDLLFNDTPWIWTSDKHFASRAWLVIFNNGSCNYNDVNSSNHVRAVR